MPRSRDYNRYSPDLLIVMLTAGNTTREPITIWYETRREAIAAAHTLNAFRAAHSRHLAKKKNELMQLKTARLPTNFAGRVTKAQKLAAAQSPGAAEILQRNEQFTESLRGERMREIELLEEEVARLESEEGTMAPVIVSVKQSLPNGRTMISLSNRRDTSEPHLISALIDSIRRNPSAFRGKHAEEVKDLFFHGLTDEQIARGDEPNLEDL